MPNAAPATESSTLSVNSCRISRPRAAPRADRRAISLLRSAARASSRFATLPQAISSTNPTAPNKYQQRTLAGHRPVVDAAEPLSSSAFRGPSFVLFRICASSVRTRPSGTPALTRAITETIAMLPVADCVLRQLRRNQQIHFASLRGTGSSRASRRPPYRACRPVGWLWPRIAGFAPYRPSKQSVRKNDGT